MQFHLAVLGMGFVTQIKAGENAGNDLSQDFVIESPATIRQRLSNINTETNCDSHQPPDNIFPTYLNYSGFSGNDFGYSTSSSFSFFQPKLNYAVFPVTSPENGLKRKNSFEQATAIYRPAEYTVTLSKCPGDFNVADTTAGRGRCKVSGVTPVLRWTVKSNPTPTDLVLKCILEPNTPYFLNVIHSITAPYTETICTNAIGCGVLFTEALDN